MGVLQTRSWQVCMQWCPNPLAGSFIFSCQHALLPSCIQSFSSPAQSLLAFSANCLPSEATSTSSGRIFDQGPPLEYLQTLCHTYHCHATVVGHYKYSFYCKHCTSPLISLFYIIMIYTSGTICSPSLSFQCFWISTLTALCFKEIPKVFIPFMISNFTYVDTGIHNLFLP